MDDEHESSVSDLLNSDDADVISRTFGNQYWRMNNLYRIKTQEGPVGIFKMHDMQKEMYSERWWQNIILKVRQIGSSTLWCIFILDSCLFSSDPINAGIIAQTRPKAKGLLQKCAFAFDNMDSVVKDAFQLSMSGGGEKLTFANGSKIESGISMRSDTIHILLISEMGKLAAQFPAKAHEVITGSLPTVPSTGMVIIESTAEGFDGMFFDMVSNAAEIQDNPRRSLGKKDMKLHFFPWWERPQYADEEDYELTKEHMVYFDKLRMRGIRLTRPQKNWWARQKDLFKEAMASEFPSYREEAFQAAGQGLYLARSMVEAEEAGQVGSCRFDPNYPVVTAWDLGSNTAIWIYQYRGPLDRVYLDFIQGASNDFAHYAHLLQELANQKGYRYGAHVFPWDGKKMQGMQNTYKGFAEDAGLQNVELIDQGVPHELQVRLGNQMMTRSYFDLEGTMQGRACIMGYRKKFNRETGEWLDEPVKNLASHGAEAWLVSCMYTPSGLFMPSDQGIGGGGEQSESEKETRGLLKTVLGLKNKERQDAAREMHVQPERPAGFWARLGFGRSTT